MRKRRRRALVRGPLWEGGLGEEDWSAWVVVTGIRTAEGPCTVGLCACACSKAWIVAHWSNTHSTMLLFTLNLNMTGRKPRSSLAFAACTLVVFSHQTSSSFRGRAHQQLVLSCCVIRRRPCMRQQRKSVGNGLQAGGRNKCMRHHEHSQGRENKRLSAHAHGTQAPAAH